MMKTLNPDFKRTIQERLQRQSFLNELGFEITNIAEGLITGQLILQARHLQHNGFVHGGVTATVSDTVAGLAALSLVPAGHHVVTAELKISYFHPGQGEVLEARGWVLKQGRKLNFCEAEVFCKKGSAPALLIAKASATMAILHPEEVEK